MRIMYASDGSDGAAAAGRFLAELPLDASCTLTILTVTSGDRRANAEQILDAAAQVLGASAASVLRQTRRGHPAVEITLAAKEVHADLIVVGAQGHSAITRFLVGSVAEQVARHASCPVLLVRGAGERLRRLVLGVDESDSADRAARWLRRFPIPTHCEVRLVTVLENLHQIAREHLLVTPPLVERSISLDRWLRDRASTRLIQLQSSFMELGISAVTEVRSGDPAHGLIEVAVDEGADLIVTGSHRLNTLERFLLDSVSQQVLCHATCSVLLIRGSADA